MPNLNAKDDGKLILDAVSADGFGVTQRVSMYSSIMLLVSTDGDPTGTIRVAGSSHGKMTEKSLTPDEIVDFTQPVTAANHWTYIHCWDITTPGFTGIDGKTGLALPAPDADNVFAIKVNVDALSFLTVELDNYAGPGTVTVEMIGYV
jgi:hypothetical protein